MLSTHKAGSEEIGQKRDGEVIEACREVEGYMMAVGGGWVRVGGDVSGMWVVVDAETGKRLSQASTHPAPKETDADPALVALRESFLKGGDIDEALRVAVGAPPARQPRLLQRPGGLSAAALKHDDEDDVSLHTTQDSASIAAVLNSTVPQTGQLSQAVREATLQNIQASTASAPVTPEEVVLSEKGDKGEKSHVTPEAAEPIITPRKSAESGENAPPAPAVVSPARGWTAAASRRCGSANSKRAVQALSSPLPLDNNLFLWLKQKKLSPYAATFQAHEVDMEVLPLLTYADLLEMRLPSHVCKTIKIHAPDKHKKSNPKTKTPKTRSKREH